MPKYANNQPYYDEPESPVMTGVNNALQSLAQGYAQRLQNQNAAARTENLLQKYNNAKSMNEKLGVLLQIDPKAAGKAMVKQIEAEQLGQIFGNGQVPQEDFSQQQSTISQRQPRMPSAQLPGIGMNAPPGSPMPMMDQVQPSTTQERVGDPLDRYTDAELRNFMVQFPQAKDSFKSKIDERKAERKNDIADMNAARKENSDFRAKILNGKKNSKKMDFQLDEMEQLNEEGIEVTPFGYTLLKFGNVPLSAFFEAPNAEALQKLSMDTTTGAVRDYGSRLFASEFNTFLKRIPELWMSQEGRRRVIKVMRLYNDLEKIEQKNYDQLYQQQKSSGIKNPIVRQEDVVNLSDAEEDEIISRLNTELAAERQVRDLGEVPNNKILVKFPDGQILPVPKGELKEALQWGEIYE